VLDFALQLRVLTKAKGSWTARGQLISTLRGLSPAGTRENPFLLGRERIALLSQVVAVDGAMLREVIRAAVSCGNTVSRDAIAAQFADIVDAVSSALKGLNLPSPQNREVREFRAKIHEAARKEAARKEAARKEGANRANRSGKRRSAGPGILEH